MLAAELMMAPGAGRAEPVPIGAEFQVNTHTTALQAAPAIAMSDAGDFVVTWSSDGQDGDSDGVFGQHFDATGASLGGEFQLNTYTTAAQRRPAVTEGVSTGKFVAVWESYGQDGDLYGIFAQRFDGAGTLLGSEFQVSTYATDDQDYPAVAAEGDFLVVWVSAGEDGHLAGIFGQRVDGTGAPVGSEFQVNAHTPADQTSPAVARDSMGGFVVVWESDGQDGDAKGVFGRRYNASGTPVGIEFVVNTYTTGDQDDPAIAVDASGDFVVVWTSGGQDGDAKGVFGQRYNALGARAGGEFQVNTHTTADQQNPAVAIDGSGDFVVAWESAGQDGSGVGVFGRRYDSAGSPQGSELQINAYTTSDQAAPAVAAQKLGDFIVTWESAGQDGSDGGVFARRYACASSCTAGDGCCRAGCDFTTDSDCPNPGAICKDRKNRDIGTYTLALARAFGRNAKVPNGGKLTSDISKAKSRLTRHFTRAEFTGTGVSRDCLTTGDVGALESKSEILVEDTLDELGP